MSKFIWGAIQLFIVVGGTITFMSENPKEPVLAIVGVYVLIALAVTVFASMIGDGLRALWWRIRRRFTHVSQTQSENRGLRTPVRKFSEPLQNLPRGRIEQKPSDLL